MVEPPQMKETKPSWQEIQEKKISIVKVRGSRVLKINSPLSSTMFNILRQFDMAYINFKTTDSASSGWNLTQGRRTIDGRRS